MRIYSVCPGNFQSSMSTAEELESQIPAEEAAFALLQLAIDSYKYESGKFYRNCIEIPW
jgi:hypothetical protein